MKQKIKRVLKWLWKADFYLKSEKCFFNKQELNYLEFVINKFELKMNLYKVKAVENWSTSQTKWDIWKFIEFVNFYWQFISNYVKITKSITKLQNKKEVFIWGSK